MDTTVIEKGDMKRAAFKTASSGTYVMVYQRPGEAPMLDLNFFDGDRSIQEVRHHLEILTKALATADRWAKESGGVHGKGKA